MSYRGGRKGEKRKGEAREGREAEEGQVGWRGLERRHEIHFSQGITLGLGGACLLKGRVPK